MRDSNDRFQAILVVICERYGGYPNKGKNTKFIHWQALEVEECHGGHPNIDLPMSGLTVYKKNQIK